MSAVATDPHRTSAAPGFELGAGVTPQSLLPHSAECPAVSLVCLFLLSPSACLPPSPRTIVHSRSQQLKMGFLEGRNLPGRRFCPQGWPREHRT